MKKRQKSWYKDYSWWVRGLLALACCMLGKLSHNDKDGSTIDQWSQKWQSKHNYICKYNNLPTTCFGRDWPSSGWYTSEDCISIVSIGMGERDLVYKHMGLVAGSVLEQACVHLECSSVGWWDHGVGSWSIGGRVSQWWAGVAAVRALLWRGESFPVLENQVSAWPRC